MYIKHSELTCHIDSTKGTPHLRFELIMNKISYSINYLAISASSYINLAATLLTPLLENNNL